MRVAVPTPGGKTPGKEGGYGYRQAIVDQSGTGIAHLL